MARWGSTRRSPPRTRPRCLAPDGAQIRTHARQVIGHAAQLGRRHALEHVDVRGIHAGTTLLRRVLELAKQIQVVLAGEPRTARQEVTLSERSMAAFALAKVDARAFAERLAVADAASRARESRQAGDIRRDVRELLRAGQMVTV